MKYLKMLGLAAIAAMGLMAFLGASSASATVLCTKTDTPKCSAPYGVSTPVESTLKSGTTAQLTSGGSTIATCSGSSVSGTIGAAGGATQTVSGSIPKASLTWSGCSTTTDTIAGGELEIHYIEGTHNGTVTGKGSEVTLTLFGVSCTYGTGTGTHLGTLTGGEAPILAISTTVTKTNGGFLCPSTAGWDAEYVLTKPHALFVTAE